MVSKSQTVRLLILDSSQNEAEALVSLLRNGGKATRGHRVTAEEELLESIKDQVWDLCVAREESGELGYKDALAHILRLDKDIPFILLTEGYKPELVVETLKLGASDVIPHAEKNHILLAIDRELRNLEERRRRRALDLHLQEAEKRCQLLLDSSMDAIAYVSDGMHIYANQTYLDMFGYEDIDDLMCIPIMDTVIDETQDDFKAFFKNFQDGTAEDNEMRCAALRSDGSTIDVVYTLLSATYDGERCTQVIVRPEQDDSELEEKLKKISSQDLLTGLYNRQYFSERLHTSVEKALANELQGALLYIAIDNFARIKADAGIAGADLVLSDIANLLRKQFDESDVLARLGDDSFAVLLMGKDDRQALEQAESLRAAVENQLFEISNRTVQATCSIGIALVNDSSPKASELLGRAHKASTHVHELEGHEQGNGVYLYNPRDFDLSMAADQDMLAILEEALDNNQFKLLFQPIISLRGDATEHYEAQVRMVAEGKEVNPNEFLPISQKAQLAIKFDRWVILQNIKSLSAHHAKGHNSRLFLSITSHTIQDKTFLPWLSLALKAARLPGDSLIFQIEEDHATMLLKQAKEFTKGLAELHCRTALTNFGCAISPFNTLKHVDIDYVKLDGSFTEELQKNEEAKEKVKEMIQSLQSAGKLAIVPQVESATVLSTLWRAGVNYVQGDYLQPPAPEMNYEFGESE